MPAAQIRDPESLFAPEFSDERFDQIATHLTETGSQEFFRQIYAALARSRELGDLRYLNEVFESWYRTLLFVADAEFEGKWQAAQSVSGPGFSAEELRAKRLAGRH